MEALVHVAIAVRRRQCPLDRGSERDRRKQLDDGRLISGKRRPNGHQRQPDTNDRVVAPRHRQLNQPVGDATLMGGSLLGKRYTMSQGGLEVLVTKAGEGSLGVGPERLVPKEAKPLPSSD